LQLLHGVAEPPQQEGRMTVNFKIRKRDLDLKDYVATDGGEVCVSTVALIIEHHGGMWYETMVFPSANGQVTDWGELSCRRYPNKHMAELGHAREVSRRKAAYDARMEDGL
jgi:hypothetical protein